MDTILEVKNLTKQFSGTEVLRGIDFTIERGSVLSIIGSSGSGKTTLLRCLNFLETPDRGTIRLNGETLFDGNDPATQRESEVRTKRLHFGLVFQSFHLFPQYTARENVLLAMELHARERADYRRNKKAIRAELNERAMSLLGSVGLRAQANHYPHQLSGGQQQRVAIARALALDPDILCFDEPTSSLDPQLTQEVLSVIKKLAETNMTMIVVTHEMGFAREVSDYVLFMADGVIAARGTPAEVFSNTDNAQLHSFVESVL